VKKKYVGMTVAAALLVTAAGAATLDLFRAPQGQRDVSPGAWAEPYKGVTADGKVVPGLFALAQTGITTAPVQKAASAFLASLDAAQRSKTLFPVTDDEWRRWDNRHFPTRQGMGFYEMSEAQRNLVIELMRASLSAKGLKQTRDAMNLNGTLAELTGNYGEYGESFYWITIMGEPSATQPWGWQLDGHHVIINYFVLGDQVVMTPVFMGSEPTRADSGRFKGTAVLQAEQDKGLAFMRALTPAQQAGARIRNDKTGSDLLADAYKDNLVLDYAGIRATGLTAAQQAHLLDVIAEYEEQHEGRSRKGAHDGSAPAPQRHLVRMDRWHRGRWRVLLPHPESGDPDRVRPPAPGRARPHRPAHAQPHPHRGAHAQRQRLRQGPAAATSPAAQALTSTGSGVRDA